MKKLKIFSYLTLCLTVIIPVFGQDSISGTVVNAENNEALVGVNIFLPKQETGVITDEAGRFYIESNQAFPWNLRVSFTGFLTSEITVDAPNPSLTISLIPGLELDLGTVISASRKREKITDSPASISVLTAEKIAAQPVSGEPLELIKSFNGVQLNQQGINRANITLRGASGVNQTTAQVLKDFRPLINPGDYYLATARSTISDIDMDRIEVIRGPSGALYGPGVSAGVVHFISKDPFRHPGTTVSATAGERSLLKANLRHAGHNNSGTLGYKITAGISRGNDWVLNEEDEEDPNGGGRFSDQFVSEEGDVLDIPGNLIEEFSSFFVETTLEYRPGENTSLTWASSVAENKGNDRITLDDMYRYWRVWNNQLRIRQGNFFGAINHQYTPNSDGSLGSPGYTGQYSEVPDGSAILYPDGDMHFIDGQLQYLFDIPSIQTDFTVGGDYKLSIMNGNERNAGRFHEEDDYSIYGAYIQSNTQLLKDRLDMIIAARLDGFSAFDATGFSPRIGFVYKPDAKSHVRASFNRSYTPSGQVRAFLDFTFATTPWGKIQVLGSHAPITFNNPVTDFFPPFLPDGFQGVGSDLAPVYNFITNGPLNAAGLPPELLEYLRNQTVPGSTAGAMNVFAGGQPGAPVSDLRSLETDAAKLTRTQAYELGYKGIIGDKLAATVDVYFMQLKDFESNALGVSPFVSLPSLGEDLENAVLNSLDAATVTALGGDLEEIAATYANIATQSLSGPVGAVQTDQGQQVQGTQVNLGFQSIGNLNYWGVDFGLEYYFQAQFSAYLNYGYISQNEFSAEDIGEVSGGFNLNTPKNKIRLGLNYLSEDGLFGGVHYLYDQSFNATIGIYSGIAEARNLIDLNLGYNFGNGFKTSINVSNLFDNGFQAFPRLPEIGRLASVNLTYDF